MVNKIKAGKGPGTGKGEKVEKVEKVDKGLSTEEKFKEAARIVFTKKGYAATKTRDIAEQAGLNLALLNYYFRSKERLFEIVMIEKVQQLLAFMSPVLNNPDTSLHEKIDSITPSYIDMLLKNPDLPMFVLSEIRNNPERFAKMIQANGNVLQSSFIRQIAAKKKDVNPIQLFLNFLGMLVFPFIVQPVLQTIVPMNEDAYTQLLEQRKILVPQWIKIMLA
jgi:AcrR family transcriptional regulator